MVIWAPASQEGAQTGLSGPEPTTRFSAYYQGASLARLQWLQELSAFCRRLLERSDQASGQGI